MTAGRRLGHRRAGRSRAAAGLARALALAGALALGLGLLAGCSSAASTGAAGTSCGNTRTAVNVPVSVKVAKGTVDCATALRVERDYAAAIRSGGLRGNGGGAPVKVDGWTCEAYPTQQVLRTGNASECHTASLEVVAVLAVPSASPATSTGS
jgi:hypothetical protein